MDSFVVSLQNIDRTKFALVGGKAASLGELFKMDGICVPDGFCISTAAFQRVISQTPAIEQRLDELALFKTGNRTGLSEICREIRGLIEATDVPAEIHDEIVRHVCGLGPEIAYAVRSSATAEDLPTASFAGQQDSYLNVIGAEAILTHVRKCWASLYSERAVIYRIQNGFEHGKVQIAVVVQKMVFPQAAGILFTADPVTGNRKVSSIDASFGLGEALVSGLVNGDVYKVRDSQVTVRASREGVLTDEQILQLARIGRKIEDHFGQPQDIEWCLAEGAFSIVQSRPITTLFPIPEAKDGENHVYVSVGHQQMMTDALKPLGLSFFQLVTVRPMAEAGGRLFVDSTQDLAVPAKRDTILNTLGKSDPLIRDALTNILGRDDFIKARREDGTAGKPAVLAAGFHTLNDYDPQVVSELIQRSEVSVNDLRRDIATKSGLAVFDLILEDVRGLTQSLFGPQSFGVIMTGMNAASWINEKMLDWLGEKNAADTIAQSVPNNVTSEMGLALLDVADVIRPYPDVIAYLGQAKDDGFWDGLAQVDGGEECRGAIGVFLKKYGMRCTGEIDITRPRWDEQPTTIVLMILSNLKNFEAGGSRRRFEQGRQRALCKEQELLERLKQLPDGEQKAKETKGMIDLVRNLSGYREYPKYGIVSRYLIYKQALLKEAERLVQANVIREKEDVYYLRFEEFREVVRGGGLDNRIIGERKEMHRAYEKLSPPRVMTSDGEIVAGAYGRENLPAGAIVGLAVSRGMVEGRARIVLKLEDAVLEEGDILVTRFTDPSWTPMFVSIRGLVTEVGGLMTHGAVIAREYGLPAVVGVNGATQLIQDGQRIRVNGTDGYVEIL